MQPKEHSISRYDHHINSKKITFCRFRQFFTFFFCFSLFFWLLNFFVSYWCSWYVIYFFIKLFIKYEEKIYGKWEFFCHIQWLGVGKIYVLQWTSGEEREKQVGINFLGISDKEMSKKCFEIDAISGCCMKPYLDLLVLKTNVKSSKNQSKYQREFCKRDKKIS